MKWLGSIKFEPPVSDKYIQIPMSTLNDESLLESAHNRILKTLVYGNSLCSRFSDENNTNQIKRLCHFLVQEQLLLRALLTASPYMTMHREYVDIRLTKGLMDYHDMDASSLVIMGDEYSLETIIMNYKQNVNINDSATKLISVNTNELLLLDARNICNMGEFEMIDKSRMLINYHLKQAHKALKQAKAQGIDFPERMLVTVWNYVDECHVGVTGGMRDLGETSLECALREAREEAGLDFTDANLRVFGAPVNDNDKYEHATWEVFLHTLMEVNQYFVRAVTGKVGDEDDVDAISR